MASFWRLVREQEGIGRLEAAPAAITSEQNMRIHSKDEGLFQAVHDLFWQTGSGERRQGARHAYGCKQLVAPYNGVALPKQTDFSWVECKNISARGLSFWLSEPPESKNFVVALGGVPFIFLLARIVYFGVEGKHYVCGCQFHKRITRPLGEEGVEAQLRAELNRSLLELTLKEATAPKGASSVGAALASGWSQPADDAASPTPVVPLHERRR
jgi:hypothetical protein